MEGRKVTMAELFARKRAQNKAETEAQDAWEQTPEGKAWRAAQDAHHQRMAEADRRYALEHPEPEADEDTGDDDEGDDDDT